MPVFKDEAGDEPFVYPNTLHPAPRFPWPAHEEAADPASYTVSPFYLAGEIAGRPVRLRLFLEPGMTPDELMKLWPLLAGRVRGNLLLYVLDNKLIRHFVEEPESAAETLAREEAARLNAQATKHALGQVNVHAVKRASDQGIAAAADIMAAKVTKQLADDWDRRFMDGLVNPPIDADAQPAKTGLTIELLREAIALLPGFGRKR